MLENEKLCNVRKVFDQFNLISGLHTFLSKEHDVYKNILPPISLLDEMDKEQLTFGEKELNNSKGSKFISINSDQDSLSFIASSADYSLKDFIINAHGVDSLNIGPEIAQIQTLTYLEHMNETQINEFYQICFDSKKWEKWVKSDFDINDKHKLIQVCGHYCYNSYELPNIDSIIKQNIQNKLNSLP